MATRKIRRMVAGLSRVLKGAARGGKRRAFAVAVAALVAAAVTMIGATTQASPINGQGRTVANVAARDFDSYRVTCYGGEWTYLRLRGFGRTVLTVRVYNADGDLVIEGDDRDGGDILLRWAPVYAGVYRICVVNTSSVSNTYAMVIN
jgi:hypothetical protein